MKKVSILLALVLVIGAIHSCGGGGGSSSVTSTSMTRVTLNIGGAPAASSIGSTLRTISSIPASVYAITITITGPEMETIVREIVVAGRESFSEIFDVPNGPGRHFLIEVKDAAGNVLYRGVADADMNGNPVTLDIAMLLLRGTADPYTYHYIHPAPYTGTVAYANTNTYADPIGYHSPDFWRCV